MIVAREELLLRLASIFPRLISSGSRCKVGIRSTMPSQNELAWTKTDGWRMYIKVFLGALAFGAGLAGFILSTSYLVMWFMVVIQPSSAFDVLTCRIVNISVAPLLQNVSQHCGERVSYQFVLPSKYPGTTFLQEESIRCMNGESDILEHNQTLALGNHTCYSLDEKFFEWITVFNCASPSPPCVSALPPLASFNHYLALGVAVTSLLMSFPMILFAVLIWGETPAEKQTTAPMVYI